MSDNVPDYREVYTVCEGIPIRVRILLVHSFLIQRYTLRFWFPNFWILGHRNESERPLSDQPAQTIFKVRDLRRNNFIRFVSS